MDFVCMLADSHEKTFVQDDLRQVMAQFGHYTHFATLDKVRMKTEMPGRSIKQARR
jgi:hypothetical protein